MVVKKSPEAPAEGFFLPPRDEYRTKLNELFTNEFNLVEKPPHARDFRSSILELYHNQIIRERTKYTLRQSFQ